jgi:glycosyltransferase involved in cell wall biosynthesis
MKISIIMPSFLGNFPGCAKNRVEKLHRAINSVLKQTYENWELIIIADGCPETISEVAKYEDMRIRSFIIPKQKGFGVQRNTGVKEARGEVICYLDSDDMFSENHLEFISKQIEGYSFIYFNHLEVRGGKVYPVKIDMNKTYKYGTYNFAHTERMFWTRSNYGNDDMIFGSQLMRLENKKFVGQGGYLLCHQSNLTGDGFEY